MTTTELTPSPCPYCGHLLELASGRPGTRPVPGSLSVCIRCGEISQFDSDMKLQKSDIEDWLKLDNTSLHTLLRLQRAVKEHGPYSKKDKA